MKPALLTSRLPPFAWIGCAALLLCGGCTPPDLTAEAERAAEAETDRSFVTENPAGETRGIEARRAESALQDATGGEAVLAFTAELPREWVDTDVESPGQLIAVPAGGNLQAALDQAAPGDIIELEAGAVYRGPFILPNKAGDAWITVRAAAAAGNTGHPALPPPGVRVQPADAPAMATLETATGYVISAAPGAHHYRFSGLEMRPARNAAGEGVFLPALVMLSDYPASPEVVPHHLIFERCYLHGDPVEGTRRGIAMNSAHTAVLDSWLADFKMEGEDSQALIGWSGPGPYRITNNYLEASAENVLFGGGDPLIADLVPSDIEIRGNHFAKPTAWKAGDPGYAGTRWSVKNLFELKNARRVLVEGNLFEYNWTQSQNGYAILFTVRNQEGSAPWSAVEDVTFTNNLIRHVANGINILGHDDENSSQPARRIVISNNLFEDLGGAWGEGTLLQMLDGADDVAVVRNTVFNSDRILQTEGRPHRGFVFSGNIVQHNRYGMIGANTGVGKLTLDHYFADAVVRDNLIIGGRRGDYPDDNEFPLTLDAVGFADRAQGNYRLEGPRRGSGADIDRLCAALSASERPASCLIVDGAEPRTAGLRR